MESEGFSTRRGNSNDMKKDIGILLWCGVTSVFKDV